MDASDFGKDDYRVYVADTDNLRGSELRGALIERLYTSGVRVVAVPDGAAAGVLLDNYLQTGNTESLDGYLAVMLNLQEWYISPGNKISSPRCKS